MTTYTVISGDTMWGIATKNGIGINELMAANPQITDPSRISIGQTINIPSTNKSTYTVMSGDTMWGIATKNGIGINELLKANPQITDPSHIFVGQIVNIPSATNVPSTPSTPTTPTVPSTPGTSSDIRALETEVIRLVNAARARAGRSALTENNQLSQVARTKSQDFINNNYFSHNSPIYGTPFNMLRSFGINFTAAAENIASGQRNAAEVMNSWMGSPGHRANILDSAYNQIGVGVARDRNGNLYWTQMFIRS